MTAALKHLKSSDVPPLLPSDILATSDLTCTVQSSTDRRADKWSQRWQRDKNQVEAIVGSLRDIRSAAVEGERTPHLAGLSWRPTRGTWRFLSHSIQSRKNLCCCQVHSSVTMGVNNLSLDRPDLSFAAGSLARGMKSNTSTGFKRVGRHLRGVSGERSLSEPQTLLVLRRRPGTQIPLGSGGHVGFTLGQAWERGAGTIASSSGESEYCSLLRSSVHAFGMKANAERLVLWSDLHISHALRQQHGKRHICSTRIGQSPLH